MTAVKWANLLLGGVLLHYFQMYDKINKIIKGRLSYLIVKVECYEKKKVFKHCYNYNCNSVYDNMQLVICWCCNKPNELQDG